MLHTCMWGTRFNLPNCLLLWSKGGRFPTTLLLKMGVVVRPLKTFVVVEEIVSRGGCTLFWCRLQTILLCRCLLPSPSLSYSFSLLSSIYFSTSTYITIFLLTFPQYSQPLHQSIYRCPRYIRLQLVYFSCPLFLFLFSIYWLYVANLLADSRRA